MNSGGDQAVILAVGDAGEVPNASVVESEVTTCENCEPLAERGPGAEQAAGVRTDE